MMQTTIEEIGVLDWDRAHPLSDPLTIVENSLLQTHTPPRPPSNPQITEKSPVFEWGLRIEFGAKLGQ